MTVRFAPSPTGAFHIGNLRTAWISHWWARELQLPWIVRFEDIDLPRNVLGMKEKQLAEMAQLGLVADEIHIQSERFQRHFDVFLKFLEAGLVYPCFCSRKKIRDAVEASASAPHQNLPPYTGECRSLKKYPATTLPTIAWRIRMPDEKGEDDFIVARTGLDFLKGQKLAPDSFLPAYHWACAIDDLDTQHTFLVRAWDLEEAARQQRWIQENVARLEKMLFNPAAVFHCSLVLDRDGQRLEKRTAGVTLEEMTSDGQRIEDILKIFRQSFSGNKLEFSKGKIFGEKKRFLSLVNLM